MEAGRSTGGCEGPKPLAEAFGFVPGQKGSPGRAGTLLRDEGKRTWLEGSLGAGEMWLVVPQWGPRKPDLRQWELLSIAERWRCLES